MSERLPKGVSVVIPVYNAELTLRPLVGRLEPVLEGLGVDYELILVNDGSRDGSWGEICELGRGREWLRGFSLMRNYGQHNAVLAGVRLARYDTILTMDDDLQHPPEELPKLLEALGPGVDVVYGTPEEGVHGFFRNLASVTTKFVLRGATGAKSAPDISALRVFRTHLRDAFANYGGPFVSMDVLLSWGTSRFGALKMRHEPRAAGTSNYGVRKLVRHSLNMLTGFSVVPLQVATLVGFAFTLFGMAVLAFVLLRYLSYGSAVQGFPFLASIIAIFSGAQLFTLGIIGEYLARMHFRIMDKPPYVVSESTKEEEA